MLCSTEKQHERRSVTTSNHTHTHAASCRTQPHAHGRHLDVGHDTAYMNAAPMRICVCVRLRLLASRFYRFPCRAHTNAAYGASHVFLFFCLQSARTFPTNFIRLLCGACTLTAPSVFVFIFIDLTVLTTLLIQCTEHK